MHHQTPPKPATLAAQPIPAATVLDELKRANPKVIAEAIYVLGNGTKHHQTPPKPATPAGQPGQPGPGETTYYPAIKRRTFGSVRAALASIGCVGEAADLHEANARTEGSDCIAVPVNCATALPGAGECIALVKRKPGGRAALMLGLIGNAGTDVAKVHKLAGEISNGIGGASVYVVAWTRQRRAVQ